jgi:xylulokinase
MKYLLGIDVGTSGTKTALFQEDGKRVAAYTGEYPLYQPHNGWAEQNPEDWWQATIDGIQAVLSTSGISASDIAGIGLSGQMHGLVMLGKEGEVLRPCIIWADQRTSAEVEQMSNTLTLKRIIEITANPPMTGFTAAKILWVQNNEPDIFAKCAHILLPKDYIRYRLTGEFATEVSDAAGMQLMDIPKRDWSSEVLQAFHIPRDLLPSMHESPDITGTVHTQAAKLTNLAPGTIVVGGAGDNPAAAVGTGVVQSGRAFTSLGSSAVIYAVSDTVSIDLQGRVHTLCASVPGKWTVMSCTQGAGISLQWLRNTICQEEVALAGKQNVDPYQIMDSLAANIPIGADRLLYLPYLMGERSPHPDPHCRGVFFGLSNIHTRAHLIRSVLEGVAYSQRECMDVFLEMGVSISDMLITGGGGRSPLWRQMLADLYNCPVSTLSNDEGPALGVALLAGVGAKLYGSVEETAALIQRKGTQQPIAENHNAFEPYYGLYKDLYRTLVGSFATLSSI